MRPDLPPKRERIIVTNISTRGHSLDGIFIRAGDSHEFSGATAILRVTQSGVTYAFLQDGIFTVARYLEDTLLETFDTSNADSLRLVRIADLSDSGLGASGYSGIRGISGYSGKSGLSGYSGYSSRGCCGTYTITATGGVGGSGANGTYILYWDDVNREWNDFGGTNCFIRAGADGWLLHIDDDSSHADYLSEGAPDGPSGFNSNTCPHEVVIWNNTSFGGGGIISAPTSVVVSNCYGTSGIGSSGISGHSGKSGYSGTSGYSGKSGYSGAAASGFSGYSGTLPVAITGTVATLTDASTVATNAALGNTFYLLFTAGIGNSRIMGAPTNAIDGQKIVYRLRQDVVGSRTVTWDSGAGGFRFSAGTPPTLTTTGDKTDYAAFIYDSIDSKWDGIAFQGDF